MASLPATKPDRRADQADHQALEEVDRRDVAARKAEALEDRDVVDALQHRHDQDVEHAKRGHDQQRAGDDVGDERLDLEDLEEVGVGFLPAFGAVAADRFDLGGVPSALV